MNFIYTGSLNFNLVRGLRGLGLAISAASYCQGSKQAASCFLSCLSHSFPIFSKHPLLPTFSFSSLSILSFCLSHFSVGSSHFAPPMSLRERLYKQQQQQSDIDFFPKHDNVEKSPWGLSWCEFEPELFFPMMAAQKSLKCQTLNKFLDANNQTSSRCSFL